MKNHKKSKKELSLSLSKAADNRSVYLPERDLLWNPDDGIEQVRGRQHLIKKAVISFGSAMPTQQLDTMTRTEAQTEEQKVEPQASLDNTAVLSESEQPIEMSDREARIIDALKSADKAHAQGDSAAAERLADDQVMDLDVFRKLRHQERQRLNDTEAA